MLRTLLCDEDNQFRVVEDPSAISEIVQNKDRHLWLDLERPTPADFELLREEFGLHPLAIEDARVRHQRPKIEQYDNFYLVVFYAVDVQEEGQKEPLPGTRGIRGTSFLRTGDGSGEFSGVVGADLGGPLATERDEAREPGAEQEEIDASERIVLHEITMFMGQNYLITVHDYPIHELEEAAARWQRDIELIADNDAHRNEHNVPGTRPLAPSERGNLGAQAQQGLAPTNGANGAQKGRAGDGRSAGEIASVPATHSTDIGILLYSLLDTIVDNYFPVIDSIAERIEILEEQVFERYSQGAIKSIFTLKKDLLAFRKVLAPERDVMNVLIRRDLPIFEQHTLVYFQDVYDHVVRITDSIDTYRDLLSSALDSFLSMQSNRLNETVQTLTSLSIILMSVAAVTGWYGMNFAMMPELTSRFGYPGVMVVVAIVVTIEVIFFKRRGWL